MFNTFGQFKAILIKPEDFYKISNFSSLGSKMVPTVDAKNALGNPILISSNIFTLISLAIETSVKSNSTCK